MTYEYAFSIFLANGTRVSLDRWRSFSAPPAQGSCHACCYARSPDRPARIARRDPPAAGQICPRARYARYGGDGLAVPGGRAGGQGCQRTAGAAGLYGPHLAQPAREAMGKSLKSISEFGFYATPAGLQKLSGSPPRSGLPSPRDPRPNLPQAGPYRLVAPPRGGPRS